LLISNHNSFWVLFDKIVSVYFIWKICLYFSTTQSLTSMIYFTANLQNFLNALESGVNLYPFYPTIELPHLQPLLWAFQVHLKLNFTTVLYVNFGLTYAATHFSNENTQQFAKPAQISQCTDFTISNDSVPRVLIFFSSTHLTCCLKFGNTSIIRSITGALSTQRCAIPYFSLTFHVILHFPWLFLTNHIPWPFPVYPAWPVECWEC